MTDTNNDEVKEFTERIEIEPSDDDELVDETDAHTDSGSSPEESADGDDADAEEGDDENRKDELVKPKAQNDGAAKSKDGTAVELHEVEGETPREKALRLEITRIRRENATARKGELGITEPNQPIMTKKELSPEKAKVLSKYKAEDVESLKELMDVMAEDMGFVRKEQLGASTYAEKANEQLESFMEKHPEYLPENDKDNVMWGRFKEEYSMFKQPANPKDFAKIFDRIHRDLFGIQPARANRQIDAAREKVKVASHAGASKPSASSRKSPQAGGIRADMLKGFTDEEIADITGGE